MALGFLQRFTNVRREEAAPTLVAGLLFFCVLTALMVVRPAREALGLQRGIEAVRWLFLGTVLVTLAVNPLFGWLVARWRSRKRVHNDCHLIILYILTLPSGMRV
jgi:AAA family ATP:ADP antiporter